MSRQTKKKYYESHRDNILEYKKRHYREHKSKRKQYNQEYYERNKQTISTQKKKYRKKNLRRIKQYKKLYYLQNREKILQYNSSRRQEINEYTNEKRKTDLNFRLSHSLRSRLLNAIRNNQRKGSAVRDLGCSIGDFKLYIESKWLDGMTWENYGRDGWHLDHIIPLAYFDLSKRKQFLKACHYTNYQPLWAKDNIGKGKSL